MYNQISFIKKAPIYHYSLNHIWEECPDCKAYNKATYWVRGTYPNNGYWAKYDCCPECGCIFDWSEESLANSAKYSKNYPH